MNQNIRILVVDDHPVVRKGIVAMLDTEPGLEVIGECSNGLEAVEKSFSLVPDIVLMDLVMPEMDGVEAIRNIKVKQPDLRILVLTSFASDDKVFAAIDAGASGYLLKDSDPEDLIRAIHQVNRGESSLHPVVARRLLQQLQQPAPKKAPEREELTERELEVLKYIAQGNSNQQIAEIMVVSKATVHTHVSRILSKLQVASRTQAALIALKEGYVTLSNTSNFEE